MTDTKANRLLLLNGLPTTYIIFNPLPNPLQCCPMLGVEAHVIHNFELPNLISGGDKVAKIWI